MTPAEQAVAVLLEADGDDEAFLRDVGFDSTRDAAVYHLKNLDLIEEELELLKSAVIRRTGEIMPELIKRGIVNENQGPIVAKLLTYYIANQQYEPKLWHEMWQKNAKRIFNFIRGHMGWGGSSSRLDS
jgi:hypothetical protein